MPTLTTNLTSWTTTAVGGSDVMWDVDNAHLAQTENAVTTFFNPAPLGGTGAHTSNALKGTVLELSAAMSSLNSINVRVKRQRTSGGLFAHDNTVNLVKNGTVLTAINRATATDYPTTLTYEDHVFSSSDLTTLGIVPADLTGSFGAAVSCSWQDEFENQGALPAIDHVHLVVDYSSAPTGTGSVFGQGLPNEQVFKGRVIS